MFDMADKKSTKLASQSSDIAVTTSETDIK